MKKLPYWFCLLMVLAGCKSDYVGPSQLASNWQWQESSVSGIVYYEYGPKSDDNVLLKLLPTGTFTLTQNDTLRSSGTYRLSKRKHAQTGSDETQLVIDTKFTNSSLTESSYRYPYLNSRSWPITQLDRNALALSYQEGSGGHGHHFVRAD